MGVLPLLAGCFALTDLDRFTQDENRDGALDLTVALKSSFGGNHEGESFYLRVVVPAPDAGDAGVSDNDAGASEMGALTTTLATAVFQPVKDINGKDVPLGRGRNAGEYNQVFILPGAFEDMASLQGAQVEYWADRIGDGVPSSYRGGGPDDITDIDHEWRCAAGDSDCDLTSLFSKGVFVEGHNGNFDDLSDAEGHLGGLAFSMTVTDLPSESNHEVLEARLLIDRNGDGVAQATVGLYRSFINDPSGTVVPIFPHVVVNDVIYHVVVYLDANRNQRYDSGEIGFKVEATSGVSGVDFGEVSFQENATTQDLGLKNWSQRLIESQL